ncbi:hypothetical protein B0J17DRAFT_432515 [Rhizoctonia solani]|nr:hypothetical protein B0J17DRAFT_432515 [Rhizoctonia solani]
MPSTKPTKPGPRPTSCLTCRRRRKKCDLARPHCERCLKSGFECLGYSDGDRKAHGGARREDIHVPVQSQFRPILPAVPAQAAHSEYHQVPASVMLELSGAFQVSNGVCTNRLYNCAPSILGADLRYRAVTRPLSVPNTVSASSLGDFDHSSTYNQIQLADGRRTPTYKPCNPGKSRETASNAQFTWEYLAKFMEALCTFIPPSIDSSGTMKQTYFMHIIHDYQLQRAGCCFMAPPAPVRDPMLNRLMGSKTMIWAMYLGAKLFQALDQDPRGTNIRGYIVWIDKFEKKFILDSNSNSSLNDAADWLFAQLEFCHG